MSRRSKTLIVVTALVIAIAAMVAYFLWKTRTTPTPNSNVAVNPAATPLGSTANPVGTIVPTQTTTPFATAEATARSFTERWGSFSSESDFQNVRDLYSVMTGTMKTWADSYVRDQRKAQAAGDFFGVTTRAMKTEVTEDKGDAVKILVTAQRVETKGSIAPRSYYQTMEVSLVKNGSGYLVDGAWWK